MYRWIDQYNRDWSEWIAVGATEEWSPPAREGRAHFLVLEMIEGSCVRRAAGVDAM